jgi:hypothetical protein
MAASNESGSPVAAGKSPDFRKQRERLAIRVSVEHGPARADVVIGDGMRLRTGLDLDTVASLSRPAGLLHLRQIADRSRRLTV